MKRTIAILAFSMLLANCDDNTHGAAHPLASSIVPGATVRNVAGTRRRIELQSGTATFSQVINNIHSPDRSIDDDLLNFAWAITRTLQIDGSLSETAVWETVTDVTGEALVFTMYFGDFNPGHLLGRFRFSVTTDDRDTFADDLDTGGDVDANWTVLTNPIVTGPAGMTFTTLPDNSVLAGGPTAPQGTYTIVYSTPVSGITGIRLEAIEHPSLPGSGPGMFYSNGNFHLTLLQLDVMQSSELCQPQLDQIMQLQSSLDSLHAQNSQLQNQVAVLTTQNTTLQSQVADLTEQNTALQQRVATLQQENGALRTERDSINAVLSDGVDDIQANFRATFGDPMFSIPGTPLERYQSLIDAILGLNRGARQQLYNALR